MPPALEVRAIGANVARPLPEHLHPVLPNATENPANGFHAKAKNETFTATGLRCRQNLENRELTNRRL